MPVRFLRNASELADVSWESPLPVQVANAKPVPADTLLVATTNLFPTGERDLLGFTGNPQQPTLDGCGQYRKLIWFYFREANAGATNYTILARATDHNGAPLGTGWLTIATGTFPELTGGATEWNRLEIPATGDAYYDQYRILVNRTGGSGYSLISKIVGVR
jgi:hypothetical protein